MIFPDYHLHTSFSSDCDEPVLNVLDAAKAAGLTSICITDHFDMDFPVRPEEPDMDFQLDIDRYYEELSALREKCATEFDLRIGVELGVMPETAERLNDYVTSHPELDFTICSLHVVDGLDPYFPEYFSDKTEEYAYYHYFETLLECVKTFRNFNVCGHLDYILRYGPNKADNFNIRDYYDIFHELFRLLVESGKGIEINTGGLYKALSFPHPHRDILDMYREAGGEIITVGSDAHKAKWVGYGFNVARDLLLDAGFRYYTTFKGQKPTFEPIV